MPDWIKSENNGDSVEKELLSIVKAKILYGEYKYIALHSNKQISGGEYKNGVFLPEITDIEYLLELRIFNDEREFKAVRIQIGKDFKWRIADEEGVCEELYISETQFLDIDRSDTIYDNNKDSVTTTFRAMGAGLYILPAAPDCDQMELINYVKYDEYGNMQFVDFRIKRFFKGEGGAKDVTQ